MRPRPQPAVGGDKIGYAKKPAPRVTVYVLSQRRVKDAAPYYNSRVIAEAAMTERA